LCVISINTLTDVPLQMIVGGAFVYVCEKRTWERALGGLFYNFDKFEQWSLITRCFFFRGPQYNCWLSLVLTIF